MEESLLKSMEITFTIMTTIAAGIFFIIGMIFYGIYCLIKHLTTKNVINYYYQYPPNQYPPNQYPQNQYPQNLYPLAKPINRNKKEDK
ncbi:MAG: hypothetical protein IJW05_02120 [Lentisphaeria bacterium]|nr:hypothetical protein [Lentisphaeria bacterium]